MCPRALLFTAAYTVKLADVRRVRAARVRSAVPLYIYHGGWRARENAPGAGRPDSRVVSKTQCLYSIYRTHTHGATVRYAAYPYGIRSFGFMAALRCERVAADPHGRCGRDPHTACGGGGDDGGRALRTTSVLLLGSRNGRFDEGEGAGREGNLTWANAHHSMKVGASLTPSLTPLPLWTSPSPQRW